MKSADDLVSTGATENSCSEIDFETTHLFLESVHECFPSLSDGPDIDEVRLPEYEALECLRNACDQFLRLSRDVFELHRKCYEALQVAAIKKIYIPPRTLECGCIDCLHKCFNTKYEIDCARSSNGKVYLMRNERNKYVKIGFTRNTPEFREKTLQSEEPEIVLLCTWPGTFHDELRLHRIYAHCRLRGEWFALTNSELAELVKMEFGCGLFGKPAWLGSEE